MTEDENNLNGGRWVAYFKYETESLKKLENYWLIIVSIFSICFEYFELVLFFTLTPNCFLLSIAIDRNEFMMFLLLLRLQRLR